MCDGCNNYFSPLDSALAEHPLLAFGIQALGLPGKRGKPREHLGFIKRASGQSSCDISIPARAARLVSDASGRPIIALKSPVGEKRERFHRALHYVGFNLMSLCLSEDVLLGGAFDPVRRYVRYPAPGETWPYCHAALAPKVLDFVHLSVLRKSPPQIALFLFNHGFAVDLFRTGTLRQQLTTSSPSSVRWAEVT